MDLNVLFHFAIGWYIDCLATFHNSNTNTRVLHVFCKINAYCVENMLLYKWYKMVSTD